jgi:ribonuclease P protein component
VPEASNESIKPSSSSRFASDAKPGLDIRQKFASPRSGKLLRHTDFERVYKQGRRHFSANMTVFYLARKEAERSPIKRSPITDGACAASGMRVGFTVGRVLGGAVDRNRMKRRLREAVRLVRPGMELPVDVVINPKKSLRTAEFETVLNEVRRAFTVIEKASTQYQVPSTERSKDVSRGRNQKG